MKRKTIKQSSKKNPKKTVSVLYQNVGGEVYAFAQVGAEVYFAKVPVKSSTKKIIEQMLEKDAA